MGLDAREQFSGIEWFGKVVVRPDFQSDDAIRLFEKLLPIYTAQKLKEIERWKKYAFEAYRITEEDLIDNALGEAA